MTYTSEILDKERPEIVDRYGQVLDNFFYNILIQNISHVANEIYRDYI